MPPLEWCSVGRPPCALRSPAGSRRRLRNPATASTCIRPRSRQWTLRQMPHQTGRRQQNQGGRAAKCRTRLAPIADPVCRQSAPRQVADLVGLRRATASNGDAGAFGRERGCVGQGRGREPLEHGRAPARARRARGGDEGRRRSLAAHGRPCGSSGGPYAGAPVDLTAAPEADRTDPGPAPRPRGGFGTSTSMAGANLTSSPARGSASRRGREQPPASDPTPEAPHRRAGLSPGRTSRVAW